MPVICPQVRACYELLGVSPGTSPSDLKKAYRRLALVYHPDRNASPTAAAEFAQITESYELLLDSVRVFELNRRYQRERLEKPVVAGLRITFGSFFGYRTFAPEEQTKSRGQLRKLQLPSRRTGEGKSGAQAAGVGWFFESDCSVLDNAAFDAIEVVYAGRFNLADEERLLGETPGEKLAGLPWVVLNNQGILHFFAGELRQAKKCYQELCQRVPNNILFTYRYGLCLVLEGFRYPQRTLWGTRRPDRIKIAKGLTLLERCLTLGETRSVGRQKCLVIRKTIADIRSKLGQHARARTIWREVRIEDPNCIEAALKTNDQAAAQKLAQSKLASPQQDSRPKATRRRLQWSP